MPATLSPSMMPGLAAPRSLPAVSSRRADLWFGCAEFLMSCTLVWIGFPETLVDKIYLGDVPLLMALYFLTLVSMAAACLFSQRLSLSLGFLVAAVAGVAMAISGYSADNDFRYLVIDVSQYSGLVLGLLWARVREPAAVVRAVRRWLTVSAAMIVLNIVGLQLGVVAGAGTAYGAGDYRLFTYAIFAATGFVMSLFPFWFLTAGVGTDRRGEQTQQWIACGGMAVVVLAAFVSATRSMLIGVMLSVMAVLWLRLSGRQLLASMAMCLVLGIGGMCLTDDDGTDRQSVLLERMTSTNLTEEQRWDEVLMMFDDMGTGWNYYLGRGFGSRFVSPTIVDGVDLAYAPHVGILTFWYKGGLVAFLVFAVAPLLWLLVRVLSGRADPLRAGAAASGGMYLAQASMSGGWNFLALFVYGVALALALGKTRSANSLFARAPAPLLVRPTALRSGARQGVR